jgi:hypothetical protein
LDYIFLHIEKTAGTSLVSYIRESVGEKNFYYTRPELLDDESKVKEELSQYKALAGHIRYDQIVKNYQNLFKMTFLRDPIDRILSFYYYAKEVPKTADGITVESKRLNILDFLDYCKEKNDRRFVNGMTYKISSAVAIDKELESAKKNLLDFDFIGIQEYFDDSLRLLSHKTGWKPLAISPKTNRTKNRESKESMEEDVIQKIIEMNQDDIILYNEALKQFKASL